MGPKKKVKTRHASGSCFGASADLPDTGNLFTLRDVLAAFERELELHPGTSNNHAAEQLEVKVRQKWQETNPLLVLHNSKIVVKKITRDYETATLIRKNKLTKKKSDNFLCRLDKLFDLLVCHCQFVPCDETRCKVKDCPGVHVDCDCLRQFKIPQMEFLFVKDQREKVGQQGNMQISSIDKTEAVRQAKLLAKKEEP